MAERTMLCPRCWGTGAHPRGTSKRCDRCHGALRVPDEQLTSDFWLSEMLASGTAVRAGIDNAPTVEVVRSLRELCTALLQPLRDAVGPVEVTSGYRASPLNTAIHGSPTSAHVEGAAADVVPMRVSIRDALERVRELGLPFDQLIYEGTWLHVGRRRNGGAEPRGEVLMMFGGSYYPYDPTDPRVA